MDKRTPFILIVLALLFGLVLLLALPVTPQAALDLSYGEFKSLVRDGQIKSATFRGTRIDGELVSTLPTPSGGKASRYRTETPSFGDPELLPLLEGRGVEVRIQPAADAGGYGWLLALLPWLLIGAIWFLVMRRMSTTLTPGGGADGMGGLRDMLQRTPGKVERPRERMTFADVAGQESAKREVAELVEFLRNPEKYRKLGAEVPHGILLEGPPGTGKTLLARALAGEADVPFFHVSASEFIELFVGVGAGRVRRLFEQAKKDAPSIIFIDELDSVGRVRGAGVGGGHDEREQTLNQILAEMDGFAGHEAVIVLAATNRPDVLDPALLRPGRFDRHVTLELPDQAARVAILAVHTRDVPLAEDVDLDEVAAATPGFSGADLKNLVNEAAMAAARESAETVTRRHFDEMRDRIILGTLRTMAIHDDERHRLAVHESGHAAVAFYLENTDPLYKVTIIPRGRTLGGTHQLPDIERHTLPEEYLRDRIAVMMGGRVSEKLFLDSLSSGADEDIRQATQIARAMVSRWGMSSDVGPVDVRQSEEHPFLGLEIARPRSFSEATAEAADVAVRKLLVEAETRAAEAITKHKARVERLIARLEADETLERPKIEAILATPKPVRGPHPAREAGG